MDNWLSMSVRTGVSTLDDMLEGGYPEGRATLLTGTPGTGKSTLAMQFLQTGLNLEEDCLLISTEQTIEELHNAFAPFEFDLDHDNLDITSLHAAKGQTFESEGEQLVIEQFDESEIIGEGFSAAFTDQRIQQVLTRYQPADRIVLDSVTGLQPMAENRDIYRRAILSLIQFFTDEFDATTLFTSEYIGNPPRDNDVETISAGNTLQYNVYGVLRLWREEKKGNLRRFIDIMKMRGVDHDTRPHEISITEDGIEVTPRRRALPPEVIDQRYLSSGIDQLDQLLGGGFPKGDVALLEHDGTANVDDLLFAVATYALKEGYGLTMIPRVNTSPERVDELIERATTDFNDANDLLDSNRMFVIDALGAWKSHKNVFNPRAEDAGLQYIFEQIRDRNDGNGLFMMLNTEAKVHTIGSEATRRFRYWVPSQFLSDEDVMLDVHNPTVMDEEMANFYTDAATVGIETWLDETGIQYLRLKKGNVGEVGKVRLVEHLDVEPYVNIK